MSTVPSVGNTPFDQYLPQNTATHIPASIVGDAVTILSNGWNDAKSFSSPYDEGGRIGTTTQMRFAMISGDTIASREISPNQGGITPNLNGGVHNFKRFLERWTGNRLDYAGSLINLYNSRNNNGSFKCCNTVYDPPIRNWVFDSTFLDPSPAARHPVLPVRSDDRLPTYERLGLRIPLLASSARFRVLQKEPVAGGFLCAFFELRLCVIVNELKAEKKTARRSLQRCESFH